MKLSVVLVCPSYQPQDETCGVGDYTRCLAEEIVRQGDEVTVLSSPEYRGDPHGPVTVRPVLGIEPAWDSWLGAADVVHAQYTPDLYRGRARRFLPPALRRFGRHHAPAIVTFHTLVDGSLRSKLAVPMLLMAARHSISANEEVTAMIRRRLPFLATRVTEIPIGSNIPAETRGVPDRAAARVSLGVARDAELLVSFGLVYPGKGVETLFEAVAELRRRRPRVALAIVGDIRDADREYRESLDAIARRLDLGDAVIWTGRRGEADVSAILRAADIFVVPFDAGASIRRGTLMAGLSHGCCVVSTTAPVPSAYLRDGDNVSLVPPRAPLALAARLEQLLGDPRAAARLGESARRLAERFAWPVIARETRELYRLVLGR